MKAKKLAIIMATVFLVATLFLVASNIFIDPHRVFLRSYKLTKDDRTLLEGNTRYNAYYRMKANSFTPEGLLLGGSRSSTFDLEYMGKTTKIQWEKIILLGSTFKDYFDYLNLAIENNKELRQVVIQLDIDMFTDFKRDLKHEGDLAFHPAFSGNTYFHFFRRFLFLRELSIKLDVLKSEKIDAAVKAESDIRKDSINYYKRMASEMQKQASYSNLSFSEDSQEYQDFLKIVQLCNYSEINVTFFMSPDSYIRLDAISSKSLEAIKSGISKVTPFVDLFFYSPFTKNISNYLDAHHFLKSSAVSVWDSLFSYGHISIYRKKTI